MTVGKVRRRLLDVDDVMRLAVELIHQVNSGGPVDIESFGVSNVEPTPGMRVIYIAGPYRSMNQDGKSNAWGVQQNVMRAMTLALEVWKRGHAAICPHSNTMFFQDADGCADSVWLEGDIEIMRRCDAVLVTENWKSSSGAKREVEIMRSMGKPVLQDLDELDWFLGRA